MAIDRIKAALAAVAATLCGAQSPPQPPLETLLAPHSHAISLEQGRLAGPGAEILLSAAGNAQFVAIGEQHNHRDIPAITTAMFRYLHERHGYDYFADEQDPVMMRTISAPPVLGSRTRVEALARTYKQGFTFISDQELAMLADIGGISKGRGRPIWGCEQAFGVTHVLDRLEPLARTRESRLKLESLRSQSAKAESVRDLPKGHFIADEALGPKLAALSAAFAGADAETRFIADSPRQSNLIYSYYHNATRGQVPGAYSNSKVREDYMKAVCLAEYRRSERLDGRAPKVLLKFGHWHLYDGWNPNNVTTLGNFFANISRWNGTGYTSVAAFSTSYDGKPVWDDERAAYLGAFKPVVPASKWRLVDLRPLREGPALRRIRAGLEPEMRTEFNRLIYGFDFALFLGPHSPATFDVAKVEY